MQIKIFNLSTVSSEDEIETVNKFLRGNRILDIDKQFLTNYDVNGVWSLFITYLPANNTSTEMQRREKVDYKSRLERDAFERFTHLRAIRKQLANEDAVPAYAVFSDAELSQIAQLSCIDVLGISKISGIGERRVEKYGKLLAMRFNEMAIE